MITPVFSRSRRTAALLIALPLLAAGCTEAAGPASDGGRQQTRQAAPVAPPPVTATPTFDSANDKPLPLDAYLLDPDQLATVTKGRELLLTRCMQRLGFASYTPPESPAVPRDSDAPTLRTDGRYGHQDAALMAKWGYHPEGGTPPDTTPRTPPAAETTPQVALAERGADDPKTRFGPGGQTLNGQKVPDHGCIGEAAAQLTGAADGTVGDPKTSTDAKFATLRQSMDDDRTKAVFARWSQCMKESGHDYPDPLAAIGDLEWRRSPQPSPRELQVATADAACRTRFNVVGVWYAVDFAYQEQAISADAGNMAAAKASVEAQVRAATAALAR
ncbi:hypothetical protein [Kitasatospora sp. NPDC088346]|uniref:hypothetical protein n=1 Tax=Kitasatospora sp. NPDC088346 TaxID=3364073 RepID=UPI003824E7DD